jgi:IclR family transcriptional regulator, mhp operon transcriptional activator
VSASDALEHAGGRSVLEHKLRQIREQGYAIRGPMVAPRNAGTVAVAIREGNHVLATIGIGYFNSAVSASTLRDQYVPLLREAASKIVTQIRSLRESVTAVDTTVA